MKKFYLTGVILMIGLVSFGQGRPQKAALKSGKQIEAAPRIDVESQRGGGGAIWEDDFSDPSTWVIEHDASACSLDWEIGMNLGSGGPIPIDTIQSTTKFNGYAMIDSDEYGGENGGTEIEDSWFTTANSIDLSGNDNVILEFETQYYKWTYEECYVVTSTNNTDWPDLTPDTDISTMPNVYHVWPGMETQDNVDNPTLKRINISESAGNQATVWIRFHWTGTWGYSWFVDDVKILPQPANDIEMMSAYISHNGTGEEYGRIPQNQTDAGLLIGSDVYNFGADDQNNLVWTASFNEPGTTTINAAATQALLESDSTTALEGGSTGQGLLTGHYIGTYSVSSDGDMSGGPEFSNNGGMREFDVTTDQYSVDGIGVYDASYSQVGSLGTNSFADAADGFMMFAYYDVTNPLTVTSIDVLLTTTTVPGGEIIAAIHDTTDVFADNVTDPIETSDVYVITQADVDAGIVTLPLLSDVELESQAYFAGVELFSNDSASPIRILDDETIPQPFYNSMIYIPNDQVYSNGTAAAIRMNVSFTEIPAEDSITVGPIGILEVNDLAEMTISPNPSTGLVNVKVDLEEASALDIEVVGIDGAVVATISTDRVSGVYNQNLDLSNLANGVYFVKVSTENGLRTEKIMIAK